LTYSYDAAGSLARVEGFTQSTLGGLGVVLGVPVPYWHLLSAPPLSRRSQRKKRLNSKLANELSHSC